MNFSCKIDFTCCNERKSALTLFKVVLFRPYNRVNLIRVGYFSFTSSVISCSSQLFEKCCTTREKEVAIKRNGSESKANNKVTIGADVQNAPAALYY